MRLQICRLSSGQAEEVADAEAVLRVATLVLAPGRATGHLLFRRASHVPRAPPLAPAAWLVALGPRPPLADLAVRRRHRARPHLLRALVQDGAHQKRVPLVALHLALARAVERAELPLQVRMRRLHVALQSRRKASDDGGAGSADAAKSQNDVALSLPVEEDHSLRGVAPVAPIPRAVVVQVVVRHHHSVWPIRRSKAVLDAAALQVRFQVREEERNSGLAEVLVPARFLRVVGLLKRDVAVGADPDPAVLLPVEEDLAAGLAHHIHIGCRVVFKVQPLPLALAAERLQQGLARIHQAS
mmetsp:Transcript_4427/g.10558  ORF Transcript_4427/g.10558 Transcript_4427/m.10558 type:complete len:299 (-) Transcript_4427:1195-2091(-)